MRRYLLTMFGGSLALTVAAELAAVLVYLAVAAVGRGRRGERMRAVSGTEEEDFSGKTIGSRDEETFLARAAGSRIGRLLLLSVLVNILTNPAAVLVCWLGRMYLPLWLKWPLELTVEALVVAVEGHVYFSFRKQPLWRIEHPLLLSVWANGCSWLLGLWLNR